MANMEKQSSDIRFTSDKLSFSDFRDQQNQLFEEHNRTIQADGTSSITYNLHVLYDENPGAYGHWNASLDEERK